MFGGFSFLTSLDPYDRFGIYMIMENQYGLIENVNCMTSSFAMDEQFQISVLPCVILPVGFRL